MLPFQLRVVCLLTSAMLPATCGAPARADVTPAAAIAVAPGFSTDRPIAGEERHDYTIEVAPDDVVLVTARQVGVDIVLKVTTPAGTTRISDAPSERNATEILLLDGRQPGSYQLGIALLTPLSPTGHYVMSVERLARETEAARIAALTQMSEAAVQAHEGTEGGRSSASELYSQALKTWQKLGDIASEALTDSYLGALAYLSSALQESNNRYAQAEALWHRVGDTEMELAAMHGRALGYLELHEFDLMRELMGEVIGRRELIAGQAQGFAADLADSKNDMCLADLYQSRFDEADPCLNAVLKEAVLAGATTLQGTILNNLGGLHYTESDPNKALEYFQRALELRQSADDDVGVAIAHNNIALVYDLTAETERALENYRKALEIQERIGDKRGQGRTMNNIGSQYLGLEDIPDAKQYLKNALDLRREAADKVGEARTLRNLGDLAFREDDYETALEHHREAMEFWREKKDAAQEAALHLALAGDARASGQMTLAAQEIETASTLAAKVQTPLIEQQLAASRGELALARGEFTEAKTRLRDAFKRAGDIGDPLETLRIGELLARAYWMSGEERSAIDLVNKLVQISESVRGRVHGLTLGPRYTALSNRLYRILARYELTAKTSRRDDGSATRALLGLERGRARTLIEFVVQRQHASAKVPPELKERSEELRRDYNAKVARRLELLQESEESDEKTRVETTELDVAARQTLAELDKVEQEIAAQAAGALAAVLPVPTAESLRALVDPGTVLLEYMIDEPASYVWRVTEDDVRVFALASRTVLEALAKGTTHSYLQPPTSTTRVPDTAGELSKALLQSALAGVDAWRLVLVPDAILHYVPFAALPLPVAQANGAFTPVVEKYEIIYVPSGVTLMTLRAADRQRHPPPKVVAALADPIFTPSDPRFAASGMKGSATTAIAPTRKLDSRLIWTRKEAEAATSLAPHDKTLLALDGAANVNLMRSDEMRSYRYIHLGTHGVFDAEHPELSLLKFSIMSAIDKQNFLVVDQISRLSLNAELVTLSGCETALGEQVDGEGLIGLARAFMYAGAQRVAASLWEVDDQATAELMKSFYTNMLRSGATPAAALRQAQLAMLAKPDWRQPYYWGAFIVEGDWQ